MHFISQLFTKGMTRNNKLKHYFQATNFTAEKNISPCSNIILFFILTLDQFRSHYVFVENKKMAHYLTNCNFVVYVSLYE
jgi:hypothetical protein